MPKFAPIHWKKFEKFLLHIGCKLQREHGDHRIYWKNNLKRPIVINKDDQLPVFIIRNNLRVLGISIKEYLETLEKI